MVKKSQLMLMHNEVSRGCSGAYHLKLGRSVEHDTARALEGLFLGESKIGRNLQKSAEIFRIYAQITGDRTFSNVLYAPFLHLYCSTPCLLNLINLPSALESPHIAFSKSTSKIY